MNQESGIQESRNRNQESSIHEGRCESSLYSTSLPGVNQKSRGAAVGLATGCGRPKGDQKGEGATLH